ncbi:MAG: hypothetical protein IJM65_07995 [Bacteroidales bacterium]|nr:hypothetical protein [Bacteroidales bacterium]
MRKFGLYFLGVAFVIFFLWIISLTIPESTRIAKRIYFDNSRKDILDYDGKYEIPPNVIKYCKIKKKILVKWNPNYPIPAIYDKYDYGYSDNNNIIMYWVIDLDAEKQIGPMDSISFYNYCRNKGILNSKNRCNFCNKEF